MGRTEGPDQAPNSPQRPRVGGGFPGWADPGGLGRSPPSSVDPGQGQVLEDHGDDEGQWDHEVIKQVHYVAASTTGEDEAAQKTSQADDG